MKLSIIYDPQCPKLTTTAYSGTYLDMFMALHTKFDVVTHITKSCSAQDIEADVILIYDIHSSHHIEIDGLAKHSAVKYTYFNDPHQKQFHGRYRNGPEVHKLGPEKRIRRAQNRGIDFIICPYKNGYYRYFAPFLVDAEKKLFWFPAAPSYKRFGQRKKLLKKRKQKVLGNGILHDGGLGAYEFRKWAFSQPEVFYIKHAIERLDVPKGFEYGRLLCVFGAALALCDMYVVPKYLEIPLAGCVCFAQYQPEYRDMGFRDADSYLFVTKENFKDRLNGFLDAKDLTHYQRIANKGRELIEKNWTAECFADKLYKHAEKRVKQSNSKET